jgi:hypothetical protein
MKPPRPAPGQASWQFDYMFKTWLMPSDLAATLKGSIFLKRCIARAPKGLFFKIFHFRCFVHILTSAVNILLHTILTATSEIKLNVDLLLLISLLPLVWHPVAAVRYMFTPKQYTEQHNKTEYTEYYMYNNKNI